MLISIVNDSRRKLAGILVQKFNNHGNYKYYRNLANWLNTAKNRRISTIHINDLNSKLNESIFDVLVIVETDSPSATSG
jgi:hypothetical protein